MTAPTIIGLSGYARSGKSTAAAALAGQGWQIIAYADRLRAEALSLNPLVAPDLRLKSALRRCRYDWDALKTRYPEVRLTLQHLGSVGRSLNPDIWVEAAMRRVDKSTDPVVVPDIRFPNEAAAVKDRGGVVVRIIRPGLDPANSHESETALDGWTFDDVIYNDMDAATLQRRMVDWMVGYCLA